MKLSAKAKRIVSDAIAGMSDPVASETWREFASAPNQAITSDVAEIALRALERAERDIAARLERRDIDADERADLGNDLHFIEAIEGDLRRQRASEQAAQ